MTDATHSHNSRSLESPYRPYIIIILAGTFYVYEFFLRVMPSAMTSELMLTYDINASGLGMLSAFFFYGYAPMQIPAGMLLDRFGSRILLSGSVFTCALGTILFGSTDSYFVAALGRTMMGVSSSFAFIGSLVLASRWFHAKHFALIAGLIQFMGCIGAIAGAAPIAAIVKHVGWRPTQFWSGIAGFFIAAMFWLFIRDKPNAEVNVVKHKHGLLTNEPEKVRLGKVLRNKQTWAVGIYAFSCWAPMSIFTDLWGVPFLSNLYHTSTAKAALGTAVVWVGVALFSPFVGWWSNLIHNRRIPLMTCAVVSLLTSLGIIYIDHQSWALMGVLLFFFGAAAGSQAVTFGVVQDNMPPSVAGTAVGFNNMAVIAGGVLFQPLVGFILSSHWNGTMQNGIPLYSIENYRVALSLIPFCGIVGILSCLFLMKETRCQAQYTIEMPKS